MGLKRKRAIAYYRCALEDDKDGVRSAQKERFKKWAKERGVKIIMGYSDRRKPDLSGRSS
jgi:hypothetical protein